MTRYTRRSALALFGAAGIAPAFSGAFAQGVADRKFIFVILRGAMDGLSALIPDDRETEALRGSILPPVSERLDLGGGFRLHPGLASLRAMYSEGDAGFVHAVATPYRDRSHFDGQDVLETLDSGAVRDGWLNRALRATGGQGLAVGRALPLVLKGGAPATNWSPPVFEPASSDLLDRLGDLYGEDNLFAQALAQARAMDMPDVDMGDSGRGGGPGGQYREALAAAGRLMAAEGGPNVGVVSLDGWDTHANQRGALSARFQGMDQGLAALKTELGTDWATTAIVIASEFGRTAAANGTNGTDHGTGGLVILAGGAIAGGKVHGDWPGLKRSALFEGRDLYPANDMGGVLKGVLRDHLGVDRARLDTDILPRSAGPMDGLIRA